MCDPVRAFSAALALGLALTWTGASQAAPTEPKPATAKPAAPKPAAAKAAKAAKPGAKPTKSAKASKPASKSAKPPPPPPETVANLADWVIASGDNGDLPFVIIDKVAAKVFVYRANGRLRASAPALLGSARGDNSTPGVGDRELSNIRPSERTTPAGRFVANFGSGKSKGVLWVDYSTAISMHPVVTAHPAEKRPQRLASPTPKDNRITYGCINVTPAFYDKVVRRTFSGTSGIVYILPETMPLEQAFPAYRLASTMQPRQPTPETLDGSAAVKPQATALAR